MIFFMACLLKFWICFFLGLVPFETSQVYYSNWYHDLFFWFFSTKLFFFLSSIISKTIANWIIYTMCTFIIFLEWVNLSKRGGKDGVFRYVSVFALLKFTDGSVFAFLKSTDGSVLALLKSTDGFVLALLRLPSIFSCKNSTVGEFWCTMAIMKEKQ